MGDTRPPQEARIPAVEDVRLRIARRAAAPPDEWGPAEMGETLADAELLLRVLDHVLSTHNRHGCCTQGTGNVLRDEGYIK
jgi:hypothetical protein